MALWGYRNHWKAMSTWAPCPWQTTRGTAASSHSARPPADHDDEALGKLEELGEKLAKQIDYQVAEGDPRKLTALDVHDALGDDRRRGEKRALHAGILGRSLTRGRSSLIATQVC